MGKKHERGDCRLDGFEDLDVFDWLERAGRRRRAIEITPLRAAELAVSARRLAELAREEAVKLAEAGRGETAGPDREAGE
ncbi:MAG: hypothetical protein LBU23_10445 [Planctomycetota bacterium]|nr:hypothetical protein [Planctomycetota bacterium]